VDVPWTIAWTFPPGSFVKDQLNDAVVASVFDQLILIDYIVMEPPRYPGRFGSSAEPGIGFAGSSDASVMGTNDDATVSKA
jgi:hypothetical protein